MRGTAEHFYTVLYMRKIYMYIGYNLVTHIYFLYITWCIFVPRVPRLRTRFFDTVNSGLFIRIHWIFKQIEPFLRGTSAEHCSAPCVLQG